jgi:uncharacterized protein YqgQ
MHDTYLYHLDKLVTTEHSISEGHHINFDTTVLAKSAGYIDYIVKAAIEIRLCRDNFSRQQDLLLSQSWNPATNILQQSEISKQQRKEGSTIAGILECPG